MKKFDRLLWKQCFQIEQCYLHIETTINYHRVDLQSNDIHHYFSSNNDLVVRYNHDKTSVILSEMNRKNQTLISIQHCQHRIHKRQTKEQLRTGITSH